MGSFFPTYNFCLILKNVWKMLTTSTVFPVRQLLMVIYMLFHVCTKLQYQTQGQNCLNLNQQEMMTQEQEFHALHSLLITNTSIKRKGAIYTRHAAFKGLTRKTNRTVFGNLQETRPLYVAVKSIYHWHYHLHVFYTALSTANICSNRCKEWRVHWRLRMKRLWSWLRKMSQCN